MAYNGADKVVSLQFAAFAAFAALTALTAFAAFAALTALALAPCSLELSCAQNRYI